MYYFHSSKQLYATVCPIKVSAFLYCFHAELENADNAFLLPHMRIPTSAVGITGAQNQINLTHLVLEGLWTHVCDDGNEAHMQYLRIDRTPILDAFEP